jgi:ATP-dependent Clp protease ATP-binding subunit ClpA
MFERFTDRARSVVVTAQDEARERRHNYIGTEHLLLGLYASPASVAARVLRDLSLGYDDVRAGIDAIVGEGDTTPRGHIPFTPRAKKVLELALRESKHLGHNYIGTEHILLGIIQEGEGVAAQIIAQHGIRLDLARQSVLALLAEPGSIEAVPLAEEPGPRSPRTTGARDVLAAAEGLAGGAPMGSQHLLEALVNADGSMAARVLADLGVDAEAIAAKVDELDPENTTDATPAETAARKMELRMVDGEVHVVLRDAGTVELAGTVTAEHGGVLAATGPLAGAFVPLWNSVNSLLVKLSESLDADEDEDADQASTLVRRVLHGRLRRRRQL